MRKVFNWLLVSFLVYWVLVGATISTILLLDKGGLVQYALTTAIQLFAGLATFSAVVMSLFSISIKRRFDRPSLSLQCSFDAVHTSQITNPDGVISPFDRRVLEIYVSVKNSSVVEALDCQLVCIKAFASEDGENFAFLQNYRSASFRWLYSSDQNRFLTTLRRSVAKYAKVVEIIDQEVECEQETKADGTSDVTAPMQKAREMHFEICLALNTEGHPAIPIEPKYKVVLLSFCLASSNTTPEPYYLLIQNKANSLEHFPTRDAIVVRLLKREEATDLVAVSLD